MSNPNDNDNVKDRSCEQIKLSHYFVGFFLSFPVERAPILLSLVRILYGYSLAQENEFKPQITNDFANVFDFQTGLKPLNRF